MRPGHAADHSSPSSASVMEELYLYPPSGPHQSCNGIPLPFIYRVIQNGCRGFNNLSHPIHLR